MKTSLKRFLSLMCVVAIGITSMASCKKQPKSDETSSDEYEIEYRYESDGSTGSQGGTATGSQGGTATGSQGGTATGSQGATTDLAKKYKGTTVNFAIWSDYNADAIKSFEKKYNIKVNVMNTAESDYINTIVGKIASGNAPDVVFDNGMFPASLQILQPITAADTINLSDPIWDKTYNDFFTFNGKVYEVATVSGYWTENGLFFYNKKLFKNAGVPTPEDLYKKGNWNWDTFETLMKQLKEKLPTGVYPMDKGDDIQNAAKVGTSLYYYDHNSKSIKTGAGDAFFTEVMTRISKWQNTDHYFGGKFYDGTAAMIFGGLWGLRNNGQFAQVKDKSNIGFTYVPDYSSSKKAPARSFSSRGYGICKGAKNTGGAGLFIRYYLDISNYNLSSEFISEAARDFFYEVSSKSASNVFMTVERGVMVANGQKNDGLYNFAVNIQPDQMSNQINTQKNVFNSYVKKANNIIENNTK